MSRRRGGQTIWSLEERARAPNGADVKTVRREMVVLAQKRCAILLQDPPPKESESPRPERGRESDRAISASRLQRMDNASCSWRKPEKKIVNIVHLKIFVTDQQQRCRSPSLSQFNGFRPIESVQLPASHAFLPSSSTAKVEENDRESDVGFGTGKGERSKKRLVITGMGLVFVFGNDIDTFYNRLLEGERAGLALSTGSTPPLSPFDSPARFTISLQKDI
ncbi:3-oxoacyl-[acyl-carrier-protein] synthase I, chloroplastic [Linum grandiflorum]